MFYTVYKTTHLESGKTYIGMHTTQNPNDRYLGSGTLISRAIKKYGRDAFVKEVLFVFSSPEEMIAKEKELVTEEFVLRDDTFNLNVGGDGGWFRCNKAISSEKRAEIQRKGKAAQEERLKTDLAYRARNGDKGREALAKAREEGKVNLANWLGKRHSDTTKAKMRASSVAPSLGERNSQYGTAWVCHPYESAKKISAALLEEALKTGWVRGRKYKIS